VIQSPLLLGANDIEERIARIGATRIGVGLTIGVSPRLGGRIFGVPGEQLTATARLLARLFAIRNVALGGYALSVRQASAAERRRCFTLNAAIDVADLAVLVPLLFRRDLRRAGLMGSALAISAALAWLELLEDC